jgi:antirestriction protein ArdC
LTASIYAHYKQANDLGGQVRAGEKSVMCVYFEMVKGKKQTADDNESLFPMCKPFWLFNVAQIDGLPPALHATSNQQGFRPIDGAEQILMNSHAVIHHGFDRASYVPAKDEIELPYRAAFTCPENYYATALHELTHWSGHPSRLNRDFTGRFGSDSYAFEELIAEIGSAFLCGHLGFVDTAIEDHASYVKNWLRVLKTIRTRFLRPASRHRWRLILFWTKPMSQPTHWLLKSAMQPNCRSPAVGKLLKS